MGVSRQPASSPPPPSRLRRIAILLLAAVAIGFVALGALAWWGGRPAEVLTTIRAASGHTGVRVGLLASVAACGVVAFPVTALLATIAVIFPPLVAAVVAIAGLTLGAELGYELGRRQGAAPASPDTYKHLAKLRGWMLRHPTISSAGLRFVVGLPFAVQNLVLGISGVGRIPFAIGSGVAILVNGTGVFLLSRLGKAAITRAERALEFGWIALLAIAIAALYLLWLDRKHPPPGRGA